MTPGRPDIDDQATEWIAGQAAHIMAAALEGERETAARLITETGQQYGAQGVYLLCCGIAEAIAVAGRFEREPGTFHGFELETFGDPDVQSNPRIARVVKAHQFLMAYLNEDTETTMALFAAEPALTVAGLVIVAVAFINGYQQGMAQGAQP
jgi:hypothetical protein